MPTQKAVQNRATTDCKAETDRYQSIYSYPLKAGASVWWLRSPGGLQDCAAYVKLDGGVESDGIYGTNLCVRPVICVRF